MSTPTPEFLTWLSERLVHVYHESPNVDFVLRLQEIADASAVNWQERYEKCISDAAIKAERWRRTRTNIEFERDTATNAKDKLVQELRDIRADAGKKIAEVERERDFLRNAAVGTGARIRELETENARLQTIERDMRAAVIKELSEKLFS